MVNALRELPTIDEIEIRLQSNEVFVHARGDLHPEELFQAIRASGFRADERIWVLAYGRWGANGFLPQGWERPIPTSKSPPRDLEGGPWKLLFERQDEAWILSEASSIDEVPSLRNEDG